MSVCGSRIFLTYDDARLQTLRSLSTALGTNHRSGKVTTGVLPDLDAHQTFPERQLARPLGLSGSKPRNHMQASPRWRTAQGFSAASGGGHGSREGACALGPRVGPA